MTALFILLKIFLPLTEHEERVGEANYEKEWLVNAQSSLTIAGSSNVNQFEWLSLFYAGDDVLYESRDPKSNKLVMNGIVILKATGFDRHNRIMTQDLQKTIRAEKYPHIQVHFLSLRHNPAEGRRQLAQGVVEIELAGVSQLYELEATFDEIKKGKAYLKGNWEFSFSDFNIEPPTKMMGAIKVRDCLTVDFNL